MLSLLYHMIWQRLARQVLERVPEAEPVMVGEDRCQTYSSGASAQNLLAVFDFCLDLLDGEIQSTTGEPLRMLDLACGSGQLLSLIADRYATPSLTGIDASPDMLVLARENLLARTDGSRFALLEGDILNLSKVPDHYYHITTWTMAAHHTQNLFEVGQVLSEMARVTHPDGILLVLDLGRLKNRALNDWYIRWAGKSYDAALLEEFAMSMNAAYTAEELAALVASSNVERLEHFAAFGLPVLQILYRPAQGRLKANPVRRRTALPERPASIVRDYKQIQSLFKRSGLIAP